MNQDIPGKYVHEKTRSHYLELKPDGNYFLFQGSSVVRGKYKVNDTEILLDAESATPSKIQDGVITDAEGDRWIRQQDWLAALYEKDLPWELFEAIGLAVVLVSLLLRMI
jgi:hypothetical protein